MINRSSSSLVSNPIICCFVTHWGSTTHGMRRPQHKKTVRTYRPLERGFESLFDCVQGRCSSDLQYWVGMIAKHTDISTFRRHHRFLSPVL